MKIFYCGNSEITIACVSGLIHLRKLPHDRVPSFQEIQSAVPVGLPQEYGIPVYLGNDQGNHQIFFIDLGRSKNLAYPAISGIIADSAEQWSFRDLSRIGNPIINIAGFLERIGLNHVAKILVFKAIQHSYFKLVHFVLSPTVPPDMKTLFLFKQS